MLLHAPAPAAPHVIARWVRDALTAYLWRAERPWWSWTFAHGLKLFLDSASQPLPWRLGFALHYVAAERAWLRSRGGRA